MGWHPCRCFRVPLGLLRIWRSLAFSVAIPRLTSFPELVDEPLLGLHNRDWPSFWALSVLADETRDGPISLRTYLLEATSRAWKVADQLSEFGRRATALLPSNREKRQSAREPTRLPALRSHQSPSAQMRAACSG